MVAESAGAGHLQAVLGLIREKVRPEDRPALERFVREYFRDIDPQDLAERLPADLFGAALSHWDLAGKRESGRPRLRLFNPVIGEHGWESRHTVIEIVNDDMPFLVDSVTMEVNRHGCSAHLMLHPILTDCRDAEGRLLEVIEGSLRPGTLRESFIHAEIDRISEPAGIESLRSDLLRVLGDVRAAVADWPKMTVRARDIAKQIGEQAHPLSYEDRAECRAFLEWLAEDHFTFLGYRCHDLTARAGTEGLLEVPDSGLGILRAKEGDEPGQGFAALPAQVRAYVRVKDLLILSKSNSLSTVHRPGYLDYVGVKRYDKRGEVCGEHRFLGMYTHKAYREIPSEIPLLRRKAAEVVRRAGHAAGSHSAKALENILDTYPRDELIQTGVDQMFETATGILSLVDRPRFRLFVRRDPFERFLCCLIFVPRENYNTELRRKWQSILIEAFNGTGSEFQVFLSESALARILISVRTTPGAVPVFDARNLERSLAAVARRWEDELKQALTERLGEARGNMLYRRFSSAFPAAYREDYPARSSVADIEKMVEVAATDALGMSLYRLPEASAGTMRFKLFRRGTPVTLSEGMPMLERMGLRVLEERPYRIADESQPIWIHDFGLACGMNCEVDIDAVHDLFEDAFARVWSGETENDDFNRLVLAARLGWRDILILRTYARYLRQIGFGLSQGYIEATVARNPGIAVMLVDLFKRRFDPEREDRSGAERVAGEIETALEAVSNLSEDRVLRQYLALVLATTRTNYFRRDAGGAPRPYLSFKLDPSRVPGLPEPKPMFEIFVYSPRFEGIHLRGGKVARGGLRWSDRPEDFRTEILGLMKAQMVKNTVIVPVGSKGGFVLKRAPSPSDREAYLKEGIACYKDYLRGLLDITDNIVAGKIVPPPQVRRQDGDDPYLVVAADKGTATFSDYANGIAREYGYWLDDAFASGGSVGFDHKKMGITARGAWESVKRHFRALGIDTKTTDFTLIGIGDMSGDVFGNGLLLSHHVKMVAAFDHRHIFIDPDPDPEAGFRERERLFGLPRSSWADYDAKLISRGGGIWPRTAKSIPLSPEARRSLDISAEALPPNDLIGAILKAPVDLLYNGGIGTYVKSSRESHAEVGDRGNDAVRVNGRDLRCRVVAEGGNLGFTQLGRIEYALHGAGGRGGLINTDAVDNSAGVDTSDHEVNIKILLGIALTEGELTERQRNKLLEDMTDDVARLVLRDNYFQTQSLAVSGRVGAALLDAQVRFMRFLEKGGRLNRQIEFLPSDEEIAERRGAGVGLASPERAVLLAYSKMWIYDELLASDLPDEPWVSVVIERYFPAQLRERYRETMKRHPLRREIVATHVTNSMVNRVGSTFAHRLMEETGARPADVVRAYLLARESFGFVGLWQQIEALDYEVPDAAQTEILMDSGRLLVRATTWFLRWRRLGEDIAATIACFAPAVEELDSALGRVLDGQAAAQLAEAAARHLKAGIPGELARRVAALEMLHAALDIAEIAGPSKRAMAEVAAVYFGLSGQLGLPWLRQKIGSLKAEGYWDTIARNAMRDDIAALQRTLTAEVLRLAAEGADAAGLIPVWQERNRTPLDRYRQLLNEVRGAGSPDISMLSVALRELRNLA